MLYTVRFTPEAQEQLAALYRYIIGVYYGGQDYETVLQSDLSE